MKKTVCIILTALLTVSAAFGAFAGEKEAAKPEPVVGGWSVAEDPAITDEVQDLVDLAMKGYTGAKFEPVALLATQVVAGTNYCLLCKCTAVVPDPVPSYVYLYIYQDLSGNASIIDVQDIQFGISEMVEDQSEQ